MNKDLKKVYDRLKMYSLIEVDWQDIVVQGGWVADNEIDRETLVSECHSVGYVTKKTDTVITLSATLGVDRKREWNQHITIPVGCITGIDIH